MERLTFEGNFCDIAQCRELPCPYNRACSQRKVWERLKAYEDTGLTPEEVSALIKDWSDLRTTIGECGGIDRLRELAEADRDGRVEAHGRWEWFDEETETPSEGYEREWEWGWRCSHCGEELPDDYDGPDDSPTFRFCYNCGAKMDGGNI